MRAWASTIAAFSILFCARAFALEYYIVIDEPINVRTGPGTQNAMIAQVKKHEQILLIKTEGDWANIFFIHSDGRKVEGWIHRDFIAPDESVRQENSRVTAQAQSAHIQCQDDESVEQISTCLLDIDITVSGPENDEAAAVLCESELVYTTSEGVTIPAQESGKIRTPLKNGTGAARMQMMIFPSAQQSVKSVTVVDFRCLGQPI
jgi:uncharacterized protein YgiM (DUF1202 family)